MRVLKRRFIANYWVPVDKCVRPETTTEVASTLYPNGKQCTTKNNPLRESYEENLSINKEPSRDKIRIGPATECMYVWRVSFEPDVT